MDDESTTSSVSRLPVLLEVSMPTECIRESNKGSIANDEDVGQHEASNNCKDNAAGLTPPAEYDPLLIPVSSTVREGDHVLLMFGDGRHIFAHCVSSWRGNNPPLKISKRSYSTSNLIGLPYGTVLELDHV
jgi:hypothetical protein